VVNCNSTVPFMCGAMITGTPMTFSSWYAGRSVALILFYNFFGGVKIAIIPSDKAEPYIVAGFGGSDDRVSDPFFGTFNQKAYNLHVGVGDRLFLGKNWGVAPEVRWEHIFHHGQDGNAFRYTGALFYQWGK